eukprot:scaffold12141_cov158-Skeletonema_dohrnii-CCMP3373.AAC.2
MVAQNTSEDSPAAIAALTCNETDALLQVKHWDDPYENFADLADYEACLPRDECSEVVVGGLPTDAYEISFDGKAADIGQEFVFDGKNPVTSTEHSFRVEDKNGNTVLHGEPEGRYSLHQLYACLPKDDACYTFLIGGDYQWGSYPPPSYSVFFDGKLVRRSDSWLFDSVQFGGSCKPRCNEDNESLIEFFMYDGESRYSEVEYGYE